jgi:hypothetical protein
MERKPPGRIIRERSDFDVMEHVINGYYPPLKRTPEPRAQADDRGNPPSETRKRTSQGKPKLRHK